MWLPSLDEQSVCHRQRESPRFYQAAASLSLDELEVDLDLWCEHVQHRAVRVDRPLEL
jgi:hypothetical protein